MRSLLIASLLVFGTSAMAKVGLYSVSLHQGDVDPNHLDFGYTVGGGCDKHHGVVTVTATMNPTSVRGSAIVDVQVHIDDATASGKPDDCRSILHVEDSADLTSLIKAEVDKLNISKDDFVTARIQLPAIDAYIDRN